MNKTKALHLILCLSLTAVLSQAQTVIEIEANIHVKDDPDSSAAEGYIFADKGILLGGTISPSDPNLPAGSNMGLGLEDPWQIYNSSNSILMGKYCTLTNAENSINLGATFGINRSSSSITMGDSSDISDSKNSIATGSGSIYNSQNAIMLGGGSIQNSESAISLNGYIFDSYSSLLVGERSIWSEIVNSKYVLGVGETDANYTESLFLIGDARASGLKNGILAGAGLYVYGNYSNPPNSEHVYMFGSATELNQYKEFKNTGIKKIVSFGHSNAPMRNDTYMMGEGLAVKSRYSFVAGRYNDPVVDDSGMTDYLELSGDDPVFMVGNGVSDTQRSNAIEVKRNGDGKVAGNFEAETFKTRKAAGGIGMGNFGRTAP